MNGMAMIMLGCCIVKTLKLKIRQLQRCAPGLHSRNFASSLTHSPSVPLGLTAPMLGYIIPFVCLQPIRYHRYIITRLLHIYCILQY